MNPLDVKGNGRTSWVSSKIWWICSCAVSPPSSQRPIHLNYFTVPLPALPPFHSHKIHCGHSASMLLNVPLMASAHGDLWLRNSQQFVPLPPLGRDISRWFSLFNCQLISFPEKWYNMLLHIIHSILSRFLNILYTATVFSVTVKPQEKTNKSSRKFSSLF